MNDQQFRDQLDRKAERIHAGMCPLCSRPYRRVDGIGRCDFCRVDAFVEAGTDGGVPFLAVQWNAWPGETLSAEIPGWTDAAFPADCKRIEFRP